MEAVLVPISKKKRMNNKSYLQYQFTFSDSNHDEQPLCLICNESLTDESMTPSKLIRYFNMKHPTYSQKPIDYFQRLLCPSNQGKCFLEKFAFIQEKYLLASYKTSYLIANSRKSYTIGEELILPAAVQITETIHGKKYTDEFKKIHLSNDTIANRISDISSDLFHQLIQRIKESQKFAIQVDEPTYITNLAQFWVYVRYIYKSNVHKDLLFCRPLNNHRICEDIFKC